MLTNPQTSGSPPPDTSEEAARAKDREVLETLRLIDVSISSQIQKQHIQSLVPLVAAPTATLIMLFIWKVAHAVNFDPGDGAALILGGGCCVILLAMPFATYFVFRAILVLTMGKALGIRDDSVSTLLNQLESKFPEYTRAIGGKESALEAERRKDHENYYLFTIPGARQEHCNHSWSCWRLLRAGVMWSMPGVDARTCEKCGKSEERECEHNWSLPVPDERHGDYRRCKECTFCARI